MTLASFADSPQLRSSPRYRSGLNVKLNVRPCEQMIQWAGKNGICSRIRIAFLVMMQGITVKYHGGVLRYVSSLVSEVFRCAMRCSHPKWGMKTLNLPIRRVVRIRLPLLDVFQTSLMIARMYGRLGSSSVLGHLSRPTTRSNSS
jgi:hypothetical protein